MLAKLRAYAELLRLSNVLTSVADVWMGMIVATGGLPEAAISVPLTAASVLLYLSGMVLNDVFDAEKDAAERPTRPIPSGRISRPEAAIVGWGLMIAGVAAAAWAPFPHAYQQAEGGFLPLPTAIVLAFFVFMYDKALKTTRVGPLFMGLCRATNVVLGLSAAGPLSLLKGVDMPAYTAICWFLIVGMTVYVTGLTYFSRREAADNKRVALAFSALLSLGGIAIFAFGPWIGEGYPPPWTPVLNWALLWAVIAMLVGRRYVAAVLQPTGKNIGAAIGNAIQSIIIIDAALACGYAGPYWSLAIFALLPPTMLMARFIPQT